MAVYRRPARSRFTLLLLVLSALTLLTLDYRGADHGVLGKVRDRVQDMFAPVQDASDRALAPVGDFVGGILHYGDLKAENQRLRDENANLRGAVLRGDDVARENRALLDQLNLTFVGDVPRVNARVVSDAPSNFELTIEIDKGTSDGVAVGMPVVTGAGLLGRVVDTSRTRSMVELLTQETFAVGVRLAGGDSPDAGVVGVANGAGYHRPMTVDLIDPGVKVSPGDLFVTSGLQQSRYPPGIPVAKVVSAVARPNALQQDVTVEPVADVRRLAFVAVLQWSPG